MQLTAPASMLGSRSGSGKSARVMFSAVTSVLLLTLALVAVSTFDGSSLAKRTEMEEVATVTADDQAAAAGEVSDTLNNMDTFNAGSERGSVPTDEVEAAAIMGDNGPDMESNMGVPFAIDGHHSSYTDVADAIIDHANQANIDVTGLKGALTYQTAVQKSTEAAMLRGSLPTYRAESKYILSGISGNYEKSLENGPTMAVVGGHVAPRQVANVIIDSAVAPGPDCTGVVNGGGEHGIGKGTPPCRTGIPFVKEPEPAAAPAEAPAPEAK